MDNRPRSNGEGSDFLFDKIEELLETIREATPNGAKDPLPPERQQPTYSRSRTFTDEEKQTILQQAAEARLTAQELRRQSQLLRQRIIDYELSRIKSHRPEPESSPESV